MQQLSTLPTKRSFWSLLPAIVLIVIMITGPVMLFFMKLSGTAGHDLDLDGLTVRVAGVVDEISVIVESLAIAGEVLAFFDPPHPDALLDRYDLAQAQGLLYFASHLSCTFTGRPARAENS